MRTLWLCLAVALALTTANTAHADDVAAAEAMFQRGKDHMAAGRIAEACADFKVSEALDSSVGTLLNLGDCHNKLGRTASAWGAFNKAAVMAKRQGQDRRMEYAKGRAVAIESRLTRQELVVAEGHPEGLLITRNGEDISKLVGAQVPVDPGEYEYVVSAPGHHDWKETVLLEGEGKTVVVEIPVLEVKPVETATEGSTLSLVPGKADRPNSSRRLLALGVGGVGLAAVATGLVFGGIARGELADSKAHCDDDNNCSQRGVDLVADAKSSANVSTVLTVVGGAALVAGGVLWFTAASRTSTQEGSQAWQALPTVSPTQVGVAITGGF